MTTWKLNWPEQCAACHVTSNAVLVPVNGTWFGHWFNWPPADWELGENQMFVSEWDELTQPDKVLEERFMEFMRAHHRDPMRADFDEERERARLVQV